MSNAVERNAAAKQTLTAIAPLADPLSLRGKEYQRTVNNLLEGIVISFYPLYPESNFASIMKKGEKIDLEEIIRRFAGHGLEMFTTAYLSNTFNDIINRFPETIVDGFGYAAQSDILEKKPHQDTAQQIFDLVAENRTGRKKLDFTCLFPLKLKFFYSSPFISLDHSFILLIIYLGTTIPIISKTSFTLSLTFC